MSRRPFLWGLLCGTLLTAMVALGAHPLISRFAVATPVASTAPSVAGRLAPPSPPAVNVQPPTVVLPPPLPRGTYRFEFNGMPVYIMPLETLASQ